jgi:hypothetical protein
MIYVNECFGMLPETLISAWAALWREKACKDLRTEMTTNMQPGPLQAPVTSKHL